MSYACSAPLPKHMFRSLCVYDVPTFRVFETKITFRTTLSSVIFSFIPNWLNVGSFWKTLKLYNSISFSLHKNFFSVVHELSAKNQARDRLVLPVSSVELLHNSYVISSLFHLCFYDEFMYSSKFSLLVCWYRCIVFAVSQRGGSDCQWNWRRSETKFVVYFRYGRRMFPLFYLTSPFPDFFYSLAF